MAKRKLHYPRKWSWPKGARICVSLNMALESFVRASQVTLEKTSNKVDHFSLTYADYAYKAGVWRLMESGRFGVRRVPTASLAALPTGEPECVRPAQAATPTTCASATAESHPRSMAPWTAATRAGTRWS